MATIARYAVRHDHAGVDGTRDRRTSLTTSPFGIARRMLESVTCRFTPHRSADLWLDGEPARSRRVGDRLTTWPIACRVHHLTPSQSGSVTTSWIRRVSQVGQLSRLRPEVRLATALLDAPACKAVALYAGGILIVAALAGGLKRELAGNGLPGVFVDRRHHPRTSIPART